MIACPTRNKEYNTLVKYIGNESMAMEIFLAHGRKVPPIPTITQFKKENSIPSKVFTQAQKAKINYRLKIYNMKNNTSHSVSYKRVSGSALSPVVNFNYMPRSVVALTPDSGFKTKQISTGATMSHRKPNNEIYKAGEHQYVVHGNIFASYEDALNYLNHESKTNTAPTGEKLKYAYEFKSKTADGILDRLISESSWKHGKEVAKLIKQLIPNASVKILTSDEYASEYSRLLEKTGMLGDPYNSNGVYIPSTNTILLRESANEQTALHEIVHSVSVAILTDPNSKIGKDFNKFFRETKVRLEEEGIDTSEYGFKNSAEFLAELMTNESFISLLKGIRSSKTDTKMTLWDKFIDFIRRVLKAPKTSLYNDAISHAMNVLQEQGAVNHIQYEGNTHVLYNDLSNGVKGLEKTISGVISRFRRKADILAKSGGEDASLGADYLRYVSDETEQKLRQAEYTGALVFLLDSIVDGELKFYEEDVTSVIRGDAPSRAMDSEYISVITKSVGLYGSVLNQLQSALLERVADEGLQTIYTKEIEESISATISTIDYIKTGISKINRDNTAKILRRVLGDEDVSIEEMLETIDTDISQFNVWFGSMENSPDAIMQSIYKMIVFQKMETERISLQKGKDLYSVQKAMNDSGHSDMNMFFETYEGKKTGFLISNSNWGAFYAERDKMRAKIVEDLKGRGLGDSFVEIMELYKYGELSKEETAIVVNHIDKFNAEYMVSVGDGLRPNPPSNPEFNKLMESEAVKRYYDALLGLMKEAKAHLPGTYTSRDSDAFLLPQIRRDIMEVAKSKEKVLKGIGTKLLHEIITSEDDADYGADSVVKDENGNIAKLVPIHYVARLSDPDDLSLDLTSMATAFFEMAHRFDGMTQKLFDIESIERTIESRQFSKGKRGGKFTSSNIHHMLENFKDAHIFNIKDNLIEIKIPWSDKKINVTKIMNNFIGFVRANNLFFSISAVSGAFKGTIDYNLDKAIGKYVNIESANWAEKEFDKSVGSIIRNMGKRAKDGKFNLMAEYNGIYGSTMETFSRMHMDKKGERFLTGDYLYFTYAVSDIALRGKLALATYDNYRLVNGKFISRKEFDRQYKEGDKKWSEYRNDSLYNAYEIKDNKFVIKKEYKKYVTTELENKVKYIIEKRGAVLTGQVSQYDRPDLSRKIIGKFLMLHRNWLVAGAKERGKSARKDVVTGEYEEGYYRSTIVLASKFLTEKGSLKQKLAVWDSLEDYQKNNVKKTILDGAAYVSILILAALLQGMADDDKDKYWKQFLAYTMNRVLLEQAAFFNIMEPIAIINSPTAAAGLIETIAGGFQIVTDWDKIEYGAYADMYRVQKAMIKNSLMKNMWEMRNAEAIGQRNKYLTSQIL